MFCTALVLMGEVLQVGRGPVRCGRGFCKPWWCRLPSTGRTS